VKRVGVVSCSCMLYSQLFLVIFLFAKLAEFMLSVFLRLNMDVMWPFSHYYRF
jgi:hypothetical protein